MKRIAVFVSGSGSNLQTLIDACADKRIDAQICAAISNKAGVFALERAEKAGIPRHIFLKSNYQNAQQMYGDIANLLESFDTDYIVLAGYLGILPPDMIKRYQNRIINIHPSLLPKYGGNGWYGMRVHRAVLESGDEYTGATVHFVDEGTDTGAVICQSKVKVLSSDTAETLQARVLKTEHILLENAVAALCDGRIKLDGSKASIISK